jgi:hypothetical protein
VEGQGRHGEIISLVEVGFLLFLFVAVVYSSGNLTQDFICATVLIVAQW